jgi:hypothetical protein
MRQAGGKGMSRAFALTLDRALDLPGYPADRAQPPEPALLPWPLKPLGSAECGVERLADGRLSYWIRHDILRGVSPAMLAWWFSHLEGVVEIQGRTVDRYRAWHPYDHVHASYARRLPDGSVGPGAAIRLREYLGANRRYEVDVVTDIEKLDETGFIHNPRLHGIRGLVRMEYEFEASQGGTLYTNRLLLGGRSGWRRRLSPLIQRFGFDHAHGLAWLRHNVEEVGLLENFLPGLYRREAVVPATAPPPPLDGRARDQPAAAASFGLIRTGFSHEPSGISMKRWTAAPRTIEPATERTNAKPGCAIPSLSRAMPTIGT